MTRKSQYDENHDGYYENGRPVKVTITAVIIVIVILALIFLASNRFINSLSDETLGTKNEEAASSQENEETLEPKEEGNAFVEELSPDLPGQASLEDPDSWEDKSFLFVGNANVRTEPGKDSESIGLANQGDTIHVKEARKTGEVVWVHGVIEKVEGESLEGWVYAPLLNPKPLETKANEEPDMQKPSPEEENQEESQEENQEDENTEAND